MYVLYIYICIAGVYIYTYGVYKEYFHIYGLSFFQLNGIFVSLCPSTSWPQPFTWFPFVDFEHQINIPSWILPTGYR